MENDLQVKFLTYLAVEKGLSPNTLASYERDLKKYFYAMRGRIPTEYPPPT
jgi:integrase/recombinase XerD